MDILARGFWYGVTFFTGMSTEKLFLSRKADTATQSIYLDDSNPKILTSVVCVYVCRLLGLATKDILCLLRCGRLVITFFQVRAPIWDFLGICALPVQPVGAGVRSPLPAGEFVSSLRTSKIDVFYIQWASYRPIRSKGSQARNRESDVGILLRVHEKSSSYPWSRGNSDISLFEAGSSYPPRSMMRTRILPSRFGGKWSSF